MEQNLIRLLKADEIECRVAVIKENGLSLLLYKDARVDQRILDETFGPFGWKRSHQSIEGNLYCTVESKENRFFCNDRFSVFSIQYNDDREISALVIVNEGGQLVYELKEKGKGTAAAQKGTVGTDGNKAETAQKPAQKNTAGKAQKDSASISKEQMESLQAELDRTGVSMETVQNRYQIQEPGAMNAELYGRVMSALKRTKSTEAA